MAEVKEHEQDCLYYLNNKATKAHKFLDQMAEYYPPKKFYEYHRTFYHNKFGICLLKEMLGNLGELAGLIHLVRDWYAHPIIPMTFERLMKEANKALIFFNNPMNLINYMENYELIRKNEAVRKLL
jgi:hypothetical protein